MKKLLAFVGMVAFAAPLAAGNLLTNPGFDETPWDAGWTIEKDTTQNETGDGEAGPGAFVNPDSGAGLSLPNRCFLWTPVYVSGGTYGSADASGRAEIMQNFNPTTSCTLKVYIRYSGHLGTPGCMGDSASCEIQLHINDNWQRIWGCDMPGTSGVEWVEICTTFVENTIDGIKFVTSANASTDWRHENTVVMAEFWVDDVYISGEVGVEEESEVKSLKFNAYPNPFISSTKVEYELPKATNVSITIYNLSGQEVATLVNENKNAGHHTASWDGKDNSGKKVHAGIYFYRMETDKFKATRKLTILR